MRIEESLLSQKLFRIYKKDSMKFRVLRPEQEHELGLRILKGDAQAAEQLVLANLRFVVAKARKQFDERISFMDLVAEGNRGLISAARKFDTTRGFRFVTFAAWDIKQNMKIAMRKACVINVPSAKLRLKKELLRAIDTFRFNNQRDPSETELSEIIGLHPQMISECLQYNGPVHPIINPSGSPELTESSLNAEQKLVEQANIAYVRKLVTTLNKRERYIIEGFFGLDMPKRLTYEEIGAHLNLSSERVRQLKRIALGRMRRKKSFLYN